MKVKMKKVAAAGIAATMLMANCVSVLAETGTDTFEGHQITYSNAILSDTRARAVTNAQGAYSVYAYINATYTKAGKPATMNNSNTSVTAVTANLDVGSGGYINSVTSKHSAQYYIQGTFRPWGEKSLPETRQ